VAAWVHVLTAPIEHVFNPDRTRLRSGLKPFSIGPVPVDDGHHDGKVYRAPERRTACGRGTGRIWRMSLREGPAQILHAGEGHALHAHGGGVAGPACDGGDPGLGEQLAEPGLEGRLPV
jgi:hypothetical protein